MTYENKIDRFHLEELIQQAWQTKDDLETLLWKMCDDLSPPTGSPPRVKLAEAFTSGMIAPDTSNVPVA